MEKFKSFITEAKEDKYRILVVSAGLNKDSMYHTAKRFIEEAEKLVERNFRYSKFKNR